jgi:acetyltransferase-like isoleucine patch superfamily enzyme
VVTAGAEIGRSAYLGDHVAIRETAWVGEEAMVGRFSVVGTNARIGARTRLYGWVLVAHWTALGEDVAVGPQAVFLTDSTMGRRPAGVGGVDGGGKGRTVARRGSRIGAGAIIFPAVEIGEEAVVGAGALVREDVPERTVVGGKEARTLRNVREDELLERWS